MKRIFSGILAVILLASTAYAKEPYTGYTYNTYLEKLPAPNAFLPEKTVTGIDLGIGHFAGAQDIFADEHDNVYIMDTNNGRIIITDKDMELIKTVDSFNKDGESSPLKDASGVYADYDNRLLYIADKGNARVVISDFDGNILREEFKPETELLGEQITFAPKKIVVNSIGTMFVLSDNINQGMVSIDADGAFQGFFGAEKIQLTAAQRVALFWRSFLTDEQIARTATFQPTEYANIFMGGEDFIYTATALETYETAQVKRLNPSGTNILPEEVVFGDYSAEMIDGVLTRSAIIDVAVDNDGFIYALDRNFGRIYMYDEQAQNLAIFGCKDTITGTFNTPVSIECVGNKVIVLDSAKANITVFAPTEYGSYIIDATKNHYLGRYEQAKKPWQTVRALNNNYEWAYAGIGRAQYMNEEYSAAMDNFKLANNKELYGKAKKKYRTALLRENFTLYSLSLIGAIVLIYALVKKRKSIAMAVKRKGEAK